MPAVRRVSRVTFAALLALATAVGAEAPPPTAEHVVGWLRGYLEIDTTNPPGNEDRAATYLASLAAPYGLETQLLTSPAGRTSLYARLPATEPAAGALVLLHHLDVVPAGDGWRAPPFSGRPLDGRLWGRGAIDTKSLGIAHLAALARLAGSALPRRRDLVLLAVADEETGGAEGAGWLLDAHPELFTGVEGVLGEGGSNKVAGGRVVWWGIEIDQKRPLWLRLSARGRGGHGSMLLPDSAGHTLIRALARLLERPLRFRAGPVARRALGAMAALEGGRTLALFQRLDAVLAGDDPLAALPPGWTAALTDSLQITRIEASPSINVIAPEATAWIDIRLLPDSDADAYLATVRERLGDEVEVEVLLAAPPAAPSPTDHALYRALEEVLGVRAPVVPMLISGITDARYFRQRGIATYGLLPFALDPGDLRGVHARDEAIPEDAFLRGVETVLRVVRAYAAP